MEANHQVAFWFQSVLNFAFFPPNFSVLQSQYHCSEDMPEDPVQNHA